MISEKCAQVADENRRRYDQGKRWKKDFLRFPKNCQCACMHKLPTEWENMYSCPQPGQEPDSKETR